MIRERIKSETAEQHRNVESVGYSAQIISGRLTKGDYKNLISTNLALNKAFEKQWSSLSFDVPTSLALEHRRKTAALEKDAKQLGIETDVNTDIIFPVDSFEQFMGALYVFEGSTLGGAIIAKQLAKNETLSGLDFNFYNCYGPMIGKLWKDFLDHLTQITDEERVNEAITAAQETFDLTYDAFKRVSQAS